MNKQSLACPAPSRSFGSAGIHPARPNRAHPIWVHLLTIFALAIVFVLVVLLLAALPLGASTTKSAVKLFADSDVGPELLVYSLTYQVDIVREPEIVEPVQHFVDNVARTMGFSLPVRVNVLRHSQPEALSAPPNYLLLTTGMLASVSSDDHLAAVVARELAHIQLGHPIRAVSRFRMVRSPEDEFAADRAAVSFLKSAGYDPLQFPDFLRRLNRENAAAAYLADRPDISLRIIGLESAAATRTVPPRRDSFTASVHVKPSLSPSVAELIGSVRALYPPHRRPRNHPSVANVSAVFGQ